MKLIALTAAALSAVTLAGAAQANDLNDESAVLTFDAAIEPAPSVNRFNIDFQIGGAPVPTDTGPRLLTSDR